MDGEEGTGRHLVIEGASAELVDARRMLLTIYCWSASRMGPGFDSDTQVADFAGRDDLDRHDLVGVGLDRVRRLEHTHACSTDSVGQSLASGGGSRAGLRVSTT